MLGPHGSPPRTWCGAGPGGVEKADMPRRLSTFLIAATLAGCGGAPEADAAPCVPLDARKPVAPGATAQAFLDAHNLVRSGCGVTISPAPAPALPLLEWSASAAAVAQAWAASCAWSHNPGRGSDGVARGENIAASTGGLGAAAAVEMWAGEWRHYAYRSDTCAAGEQCGHYTQLVWRGTTRVGCATARCTTGSPFTGSSSWTFVVCDYEPPGNFRGQQPY